MPKYKIGDRVWIMYDNKPKEVQIASISQQIYANPKGEDKIIPTYGFDVVKSWSTNTHLGATCCYPEEELFKTKDELIDSLR